MMSIPYVNIFLPKSDGGVVCFNLGVPSVQGHLKFHNTNKKLPVYEFNFSKIPRKV